MSAQGEIRYNNVDELLVRMKKETFEENVKLRAMKDTIIQHINDLMPRLDIHYNKFIHELQTKEKPENRKIMIMTVKRNNIYQMYETLKEHMEKRIAEGDHIVSSVASLQSDSSLHLKEKEKKTSELLKLYHIFAKSRIESNKKYTTLCSVYSDLWEDLTIHNTNHAKKVPNQSRKINKLGQPGRARRYDTSLESVKEDNNANNANNAGASGGTRRQKRTHRTLRKKHTRRHRA